MTPFFNISDYDTAFGRPPLNALVVRGDTGEPGDSWEVWRKGSDSPYKTLKEAWKACWEFWA